MNPWEEGKSEAKKSGLENVLLGLLMGFWVHWPAIWECIKTCDTWIMKVEKVLTYVAFTLGFSKPGLLVFKVFKNLINDVSIKMTGMPMSMNERVERIMQTVISFGGQYGLSGIWDWAKDSTICLQSNECEGDFLIAITNMKHQYCGEEVESTSSEDESSTTFCHQMWNESPLIVIVGLALILYFIAKYETDSGDDGDPPPPTTKDGENTSNTGGTNDTSGSTTPSSPPNDPNSSTGSTSGSEPSKDPGTTTTTATTTTTTTDPNTTTTTPSTDPTNSTPKPDPPAPDPSNTNPPQPQPQPPNNPIPTPGNPGAPGSAIQLLETYCPTCNKAKDVPLVNPSPMFCKHCRDGPPGGGGGDPSNSNPSQSFNPTPSRTYKTVYYYNSTTSTKPIKPKTNLTLRHRNQNQIADCINNNSNNANSYNNNDSSKSSTSTPTPSPNPSPSPKPSSTDCDDSAKSNPNPSSKDAKDTDPQKKPENSNNSSSRSNDSDKNKNKRDDDGNGGDDDPSGKILSKAIKRHINEVLRMVAQGVCAECQDQLDQLIQCANNEDYKNNDEDQPPDKITRPNSCPHCNHPHDKK